MFGTRAGWIVDLAYLIVLIAPFVAGLGVRLARQRQYDRHRALQTLLVITGLLPALAIEGRIRVAGGAAALIRESPYAGTPLMDTVAAVHITGALATYLVWIGLVVSSRRRYRSTLPGDFSRRHRRLGLFIIGGLAFTAVSATVIYTLAFVVQ